jgi:hypothetical protein
MKFKANWNSIHDWFIGVNWASVKVTKFNPVQEGWMFRLGFGLFTLWLSKWRVLTMTEQDTVKNG